MSRIDVTAAAAALSPEQAVAIEHDERLYALVRTADGLFAVDGICPHATTSLANGFVFDNVIECPLHQAQFDVTNGAWLSGPQCADLQCFAIVNDNGQTFIDVAD